jgi:hypothetical protein
MSLGSSQSGATVTDNHDLGRYSGDGFTEEERQFLRRMMEEEKRVAWFWATVRRWAFWTATTVAAVVTFRDNLKALFLWFIK